MSLGNHAPDTRQERTPRQSGSALLLSWDDSEEFAVVPFLVVEDIPQRLLVDIAVELCEVLRELDVFRACLLAVLTVAAARDAALAHEGFEARRGVELSERMQVEEQRLHRRRRADEVGLRTDVRACLKAAAARHAV